MCLVASNCFLCTAPAGTHYEGCEVLTRERPATRVPSAVALERERSLALDAWLRGAPVPVRGGYVPPEPAEVM